MAETLESRILGALTVRPGQKADELAKAVGASRTDVNQLL